MFGRKSEGFSDTKSGTVKRRSAAMGGWVLLTHIASFFYCATLWSKSCMRVCLQFACAAMCFVAGRVFDFGLVVRFALSCGSSRQTALGVVGGCFSWRTEGGRTVEVAVRVARD